MTPTVLKLGSTCYPWRAKWRRISGLGIQTMNGEMLLFVDSPSASEHVDALIAGADFCAIAPLSKKNFYRVHTVTDGKLYTSMDCAFLGGSSIEKARAFDMPEEDDDLLRRTLEALA